MPHNFILLKILLTFNVLSLNVRTSTLFNQRKSTLFKNELPNEERFVAGEKKSYLRNGVRHPFQRQLRIQNSQVLSTKNDGKGYLIFVDVEKPTEKVSKRGEIADVNNEFINDNELRKEHIKLKSHFEILEEELANISKLNDESEPRIQVILIKPKASNESSDKTFGSEDFDNLFVQDISSKEDHETIASVAKNKDDEPTRVGENTKTDNTDHANKDLQEISSLLADKNSLNEVVREMNLLRDFTQNENSSELNVSGNKNVTNTKKNDNVMSKVKDLSEHEIGYIVEKPKEKTPLISTMTKQHNDVISNKTEHAYSNRTGYNKSSPRKKQMLSVSNPDGKYAYLNLPHHQRKTNQRNPLWKIIKNKQATKTLQNSTKNPEEQVIKEFLKTTGPKIIDKQKAEAIIEILNRNPLEVWRYAFKDLNTLALNSSLLRSGLVNPGNIERLKGVMRRALEGKSITISIVGGSISAGGGLYKDEKSIAGLYYKGLLDWWKNMITPLTGADMLINNVAIGSIGTDYFSYCVKNHIANESDIVLWELSANDYNRYKMQPSKGARPLERFTRMVLELPNKPALLYINFFKGVDFKATRKSCPDFEDEGEDIIAHYYRIPSFSWRAMVCNGLVNNMPGYGIETLFSHDQYHPSIRGHAQMSLLLLLHLRHVMRAVLKWAIAHDGYIAQFEDFYIIPEPLFMGPKYPEPLCWSLISPDLNQRLTNSLYVKVKAKTGFKLEYATNFPIRFDKVVCWKAEKPLARIALQFYIPEEYGSTGLKRVSSEVAITTHTRWGGSSSLWIDDNLDKTIVINEGREHDPGKRTQVDSLVNGISPGYHTLHAHAHDGGFCLSAIMVDSS